MYFYHMCLLLSAALLARPLLCFALQVSLYLGQTLREGTTYSAQQYNFKIVNNHNSKLDNAFYEPMFNFHMTKASPLWSHDCFIAIGMFLQLLLTLLNALLSTVEQRQPVLEQQTRLVLRALQASFITEYENWKHCLLQVNT